MTDFAQARRTMVDGQVRTNDVTDPRLLSALLEVPRERFVPAEIQALAYLDRDVPVGGAGRSARYLLKPMVLAKLIQAADVRETDCVLDVGVASGYSAAILGRLAASVVALEEDAALGRRAAETLAATGASNVQIATGTLGTGWPGGGPYDVIVLEGSTEIVPQSLFGQLKDSGRLVCVLGRAPIGKAMIYRCAAGHVSAQPAFDATAPLLPGFAKPAEFVF